MDDETISWDGMLDDLGRRDRSETGTEYAVARGTGRAGDTDSKYPARNYKRGYFIYIPTKPTHDRTP